MEAIEVVDYDFVEHLVCRRHLVRCRCGVVCIGNGVWLLRHRSI